MKKESKRHWFIYLKNIIFSLVIIGLIFYAGLATGKREKQEIQIIGIPDTTGQYENVDFDIFWEAWNLIREKHLKGDEVKNRDLIYGAISGLTYSLDDPYSVFLPPEDSQKFQEDVDGNFGGVGMEIEVKNSRLLVVAPLKNTPADRAGIKAGDYIVKIEDELTDGLDVGTAVKKIRGEIGTTVNLTVIREGNSDTKKISIERANILIPTVDFEMKDNIAYIHLLSFNNNSIPLFYESILRGLFSGAEGLIIDLRNNPGGYLEVATRLGSWFVNDGEVIVSEEFRSGDKKEFKATGGGALKNLPLVIIINKGSASASEILAGSLRDLKGAKLIGETTFGKGTVQELIPLSDGSLIKITTAHWVLPSGYILDENGLKPDIEIPLTEEDVKNKKDPQLDKALEIIKQSLK